MGGWIDNYLNLSFFLKQEAVLLNNALHCILLSFPYHFYFQKNSSQIYAMLENILENLGYASGCHFSVQYDCANHLEGYFLRGFSRPTAHNIEIPISFEGLLYLF